MRASSALPAVVVAGLASWATPAAAGGAAKAVDLVGAAGTSPADALLVGAGGELYKRSGTTWKRTNEGGTAATLVSARGGSPADIWAIGANTPAYRYDGKTWSVVKLGLSGPALLSRGAALALAVGRRVYLLALGKWQILPALPPATTFKVIDLWAAGPKDAIVLGDNGEMRRWNGAAWNPIRHGLPAGETPRRLLAGPAGQVFAVGDGGTLIRIERLAARRLAYAAQIPAGTRWLAAAVAQNKLWLAGEAQREGGPQMIFARVDNVTVALVDTFAAPEAGDEIAAMVMGPDAAVIVATRKGIVHARAATGQFTRELVDGAAPMTAPHPPNPPAVQGGAAP